MQQRNIQREIEQAILDHVSMPSALRNVIDTLNTDLYCGPIYTDGRGEWLDCFDKGAKQFDYPRACRIVRAWLDEHVNGDLWYDVQTGQVLDTEPAPFECSACDGERQRLDRLDLEDSLQTSCWVCNGTGYEYPLWEDYYHIDAASVRQALLGRELAATI